jgi:hypothetical protein
MMPDMYHTASALFFFVCCAAFSIPHKKEVDPFARKEREFLKNRVAAHLGARDGFPCGCCGRWQR